MLPILEAVSFLNFLPGGSTKPWLITVCVNGKIEPYVVKVFTKTQILQNQSVAKEVISNRIAYFLDLQVPDISLIRFNKTFLNTLSEDLKKDIKEKDYNIKFGSKYIENCTTFSNSNNKILKRYDIESIYAFDNLIRNADRKHKKPNILFSELKSYLIDHELSLSVNQSMLDEFIRGNWTFNYKSHIFYDKLKRATKSKKKTYFQTFQEYLKTFNVKELDPFYKQLFKEKQYLPNYDFIKDYLNEIKRDSNKFVEILRTTIE